MNRIRLVSVVFIVALLVNVSNAFADDFISFEEVERLIYSNPNHEVSAYFKTVEKGTDIKTFKAVLRGVYIEPGLKVIMFVTSHSIAGGMSGSPFYVNGKQIGALAYSFNDPRSDSDWFWGGISPLSMMLKEADSGPGNFSAPRTFNYNGMMFEPISFGYESASVTSDSVDKFLTSVTGKSLKPGMPIVVDLIEWKDEKGETTTVSAMGTITYVDDKGRVFAFGHPFLSSKNVVYSFRTAEVIGTPQSRPRSFKLSGKKSSILGVITFDGTYGIYGSIRQDDLKKLHSFTLEFKNNGKPEHKFEIKVADSVLTPMLARNAFKTIGGAYGAPMSQEASITQLDVRVDLDNGEFVVWSELFASGATQFGPSTIYTSSYEAASEAFFNGIYGALSGNNYGLKITKVSISANFIRGKSQVFRLRSYKFPNKVVWGQDPILELVLMSQDNLVAIAKKVSVKIDWNKIEKPSYTKETLDTEKASEKIVQGLLRIESADSFFRNLYGNERQKFMPEYFLGPEDYLAHLSSRLAITNQKIFSRIFLKSRSGLFDEATSNTKDTIQQDVSVADGPGWQVINGGSKEIKTTVKDDGAMIFYVDLPQIPNGYVIDPKMQEVFYFEVVLEQ